jgi:hypothetical protein
MTQYTKTVFISSVNQLPKLKVGQWLINEVGQRGQWLGVSKDNISVIRWENQKFDQRSAMQNKHLRDFAKVR